MINANKILHAKVRYDKILTADEAKKRLKYLDLDGSEHDLEAYFAILATCLEKEGFNDKELINILLDIKKMTEFKELLNTKVAEFLRDSRACFDVDSVQAYIDKHINPYYEFRFRIDQSRELSFLPLDLRLFTYNRLLQLGEGGLTAMHYLDRIEVTLAKLGQKNLASVIAAFKWVLNWGVFIGSNTDMEFKKEIKFLNDVKEIRNQKLKILGINEGGPSEEVVYSISGFAYQENIHDKKIAEVLLPLLKIYFKDFDFINKYVGDLETYIKTGNEEHVKDIRKIVEERKFGAVKHTEAKEDKKNSALRHNNIKETSVFKIDTKAKIVLTCIQGKTPIESKYNEKTRKYKVKFDYKRCLICEQFKDCPVSLVKEGQFVKITQRDFN